MELYILWNHDYQNPVGKININEQIKEMLSSGASLILTAIKSEGDLIGVSLRLAPNPNN